MRIMQGVACVAAALWSASAAAGVVIVQTTTSPDGQGGTKTETETIQLEGNRQRSGTDQRGHILDLDKATIVMWDASLGTTAMEYPLKGKDGPGAMIAAGMAASWNLKFTPTGKSRQVAGLKCDEHTGKGKMMVEVQITGCFAQDAPGAAEYRAFYARMMQTLGTGGSVAGYPEGVMLDSRTVTEPMMVLPPEMLKQMPPDVQKQMAEAAKPQVATTVVTRIKAEAVPASAFAIPAGFTKAKEE